MSKITDTGGISFAGPLALSGLALSKEYLLKLMDNYMGYMIGMYSLMTENVEAYASAISTQAKSEKEQMLDQAWSDLAGGLSEGLGMICSAGTALAGGTHQTRGLNAELGEVKSSRDNLLKAHSDMLETAGMPKEQLENNSRSSATVGDAEEAGENTDLNKHRQVLEKLANEDRSALKELGGKESPQNRQKVKNAIAALRRSSEAPIPEGLAPEEEMSQKNAQREDKARIENATKSVSKQIKRLGDQEGIIHSQIEGINRRWQSYGELVKGGVNIIGGAIRFAKTNEAADDKYKAAQAAGAVQMAQSSVQQSEKTAIDASGQASDLMRQLKELQANNSSRA